MFLEIISEVYTQFLVPIIIIQILLLSISIIIAIALTIYWLYKRTYEHHFIRIREYANSPGSVLDRCKFIVDDKGICWAKLWIKKGKVQIPNNLTRIAIKGNQVLLIGYESAEGDITFASRDKDYVFRGLTTTDRVIAMHQLEKAQKERSNPMDKFFLPIVAAIALVIIIAIAAVSVHYEAKPAAEAVPLIAEAMKQNADASQRLARAIELIDKSQEGIQTFEGQPGTSVTP